MKLRKAFWACSLALPATIIPLATATSCNQSWGYKTPLSVGTSNKGDANDPFINFRNANTLVDLSGNEIVSYLQSNYITDKSYFYGYSLPEKWDEKADAGSGYKGKFVDGSAAWLQSTADAFVRSGTKRNETEKKAEIVYSYRNNTLPSNIALIGTITTNLHEYVNAALHYQGSQIGTDYGKATETDSNLAISWGGNITHGEKESEQNRKFMEAIFASNAISGTSIQYASLRPTSVNFSFEQGYFPVVSYIKDAENKITGLSDDFLALINGVAKRPKVIIEENKAGADIPTYWSDKTEPYTEKVIETGKDPKEYTYVTYTFTNVPVLVTLSNFSKAYVNPNKADSIIVSDYYSPTKKIKEVIGQSWQGSLSKFSTFGEEKPTFKSYSYTSNGNSVITPVYETVEGKGQYDHRIEALVDPKTPRSGLFQNSFIVLMNFAYKECQSTTSGEKPESLDRASMTDLVGLFPAYWCDKNLGLEKTFFKKATTSTKETNAGYIFDIGIVNKYNKLYTELMSRTAGQGLVVQAKDLNETSKKLLSFLKYMFGNNELVVDSSNFISTQDLDPETK